MNKRFLFPGDEINGTTESTAENTAATPVLGGEPETEKDETVQDAQNESNGPGNEGDAD